MRPEGEPRREIEPAEIAAFAATFIPRWDRYSAQRPEGHYVAVHEPLSVSLVYCVA